jgi:branched-chain amino acid transport system substrate-binding protein
MSVVFIALILAVVLGTSGQFGNKDLTITAMFPMTGGLSSYGDSASRASILAVEEINASGGINGKTLKLNLQDHKCDTKEAVAIYKQFKSKTNVFTSAACSGTALAIAPMLENDGSVLLGSTLSTPKISGVSKNLFRNWSSDAKEAELFAGLLKGIDYKKIGIIYEETDYAKGLKDSLEKNILASSTATLPGPKQVYSEGFVSGSMDVRSQLLKLQSEGVDVLFISPQTVTSAEIIAKQMTELGFKPKTILVNDNVIKADNLLSKYPTLFQGAYGADYRIENSKAIEDFKSKYKARFGEDCKQVNICIAQYDNIKIMAKALSATASSNYNRSEIQAYIKSVNYEGVSGKVSFDKNNDRSDAEYSLLKVDNGKATMI